MSDYWGDMHIFFGGRSKEEVMAKFDELMDAASDHICGPDITDDHECAFDWTAGGSVQSDEQMEVHGRKEDAADAMYDALRNIVAITLDPERGRIGRIIDVREEAERALRIADAGYEPLKSQAQRRRH